MEKISDFGQRLKQIRCQRSLSQEELAFQCNMQASHIGQIERGQKSPTLETLMKISHGLRITLPELFDYDTELKTENETVNKINAYLSALDEKQKKQVLAIIKTFTE